MLFVHPNTVRYRLGKIADLTGYQLTDPHDAHTVRIALALGRLEPPVRRDRPPRPRLSAPRTPWRSTPLEKSSNSCRRCSCQTVTLTGHGGTARLGPC